jgi:hypothetical protein
VQVHHASEGGGEPHAVGDGTITVKSDHLVLFGHVVQKTENRKNKTIHRFCDLISVTFLSKDRFFNSRPKRSENGLICPFISSNFIEGFHVGNFPLTSLIDVGIDQ